MSWSTLTAAGSWVTTVTASGSWATEGVGVVPPPWALLSSVTTTADTGVDFTLTMREQYPMRVSTDRPIPMYDVHPEGTP